MEFKADTASKLAAALKTTDETIKAVDEAGAPNVKSGNKIATDLYAAFAGTRPPLAAAQKSVHALDPADAAFFDKIEAIFDKLEKDAQPNGGKVEKVASRPEVVAHIEAAPACN